MHERETDAAIDGRAAAMLERTVAWAAVNSGTANLAGLATMAGLLADAFSALPGKVRLVDPDPVEQVDAAGRATPVRRGRHLHLAVRPHAPVQILLTGHMDTVFAADDPFQAVTRLGADRIGGPGVADMKGGLVAMLAALEAFETTPRAAGLGYEVVVNADEETGSGASAALIARAAQGKAASLTYEPALADGGLAGARPGSGNFAFVVRGRRAHAGRNPEDGRNAVAAAADLALRLAAAAGAGLSVNPARIEGGGPNNVVPDLAVLHVNLRPATPADQRRAEAAIAAAVARVGADHEVAVLAHGGFARPPKPLDRAAERLHALVHRCGIGMGLALASRTTGGVCDGNNIAACGVPVVDTMGVRGGGIHSPGEYLEVASLAERAKLSARVLLALAEGGRP